MSSLKSSILTSGSVVIGDDGGGGEATVDAIDPDRLAPIIIVRVALVVVNSGCSWARTKGAT
jgi:hypothetical protein